jgi:iron complex outermembrane receptor protein
MRARTLRALSGIAKGKSQAWIKRWMLASCLAACLCGTALAQDERRYALDLPAMSVAEALNELSVQAGVPVLFPFDLARHERANAVTGTFTLQQALDLLLRGTGLSGGLSSKGVLTISRTRSDALHSGETSTMPNQNTSSERAARGSRKTFVSGLFAFLASAGGAATAGAQSVDGASGPSAVEEGGVINEVTVTGSRMKKQISDVTTSISVVSEEDLADQFAISTDVLDALNATVPGLNVSQGFKRIGCNMNVRGRPASFQINGIPVNQDLNESHCNTMFLVSPFALERIEVLRGSTALYGAGAPGGVINLITRRASSDKLEIDGNFRMSGNTHGSSDGRDYDAYLGAGRQLGAWDYYAGLAYQNFGAAYTPTGELVPREELTSWSMNTSLGRSIGDHASLRFTGTFYREKRGQEYSADGTQVNGQLGDVIAIDDNPFRDESHDELVTLAVSYDNEQFLGHQLSLSAYMQRQEFIQRANSYNILFGGNSFFNSNLDNERFGIRSTLSRDFDLGAAGLELDYGIDYVSNTYYRPVVGPATDAIIGWVSPDTTMDTTSGFAQADVVWSRFRLSGGARYEKYEGTVGSKGYDPLTPNATVPGDVDTTNLTLINLGGVYDLTDSLQIYGGFSQGAELSQLARAVRGQQNPGLLSPEPATSDQIELGVRGKRASAEFSLAVFYSESDKAALLQANPSCAGQPGLCPLIPLRAPQRFKGVEATFDWNVSERWAAGGLLTLQKGVIYNAGLGRYIEYSSSAVSPGRLTAYAQFAPFEGFQARLQGTYYAAADYFTPGEQSLGFFNSDSLFLADLSSSYKIGPGEVTLSVSNLLDKEYVNVANQGASNFFYFMEEGRRVSLGYRVRL